MCWVVAICARCSQRCRPMLSEGVASVLARVAVQHLIALRPAKFPIDEFGCDFCNSHCSPLMIADETDYAFCISSVISKPPDQWSCGMLVKDLY